MNRNLNLETLCEYWNKEIEENKYHKIAVHYNKYDEFLHIYVENKENQYCKYDRIGSLNENGYLDTENILLLTLLQDNIVSDRTTYDWDKDWTDIVNKDNLLNNIIEVSLYERYGDYQYQKDVFESLMEIAEYDCKNTDAVEFIKKDMKDRQFIKNDIEERKKNGEETTER